MGNRVRAFLRLWAEAGPDRRFALFAAFLATATGAQAQPDPQPSPSPAIPIEVVGRRAIEPHVFGTVAVRAGTTPMSARWARIMSAPVDEAALARLTAGAWYLAPQQQAAYVHDAVNRAARRRIRGHCRFDDGYWAAGNETLKRGMGDCIDIAVAKMEALRRLGFGADDLYLTTGRAAGGLEAALLVRIGDRLWLLDDHSSGIVEAGRSTAFEPTVTYGVDMTWAHGRRIKSPFPITRTAGSSKRYGALAPARDADPSSALSKRIAQQSGTQAAGETEAGSKGRKSKAARR